MNGHKNLTFLETKNAVSILEEQGFERVRRDESIENKTTTPPESTGTE
ncbi:MAG: hypothetical protein LBJ67_16280 [Planctomycetaceae bacterium]|jgi:hypothetical protein|nr:hypothetical protein [Planctomycetaceae bacterium]